MKRPHLVGLVVVLGGVLRLLRAGVRWEEWAWRYAAYPGPTADALAAGDLAGALTTFTGMHPPLWPLLHAGSELLVPVPALWLLGSAAVGAAAVWLVAREAWLAGLVLATSPVALHYAAEVNDYPLLTFFVAAIWVLRGRVTRGEAAWGWLALVGALAGWTHALGGLVAGVAALTLPTPLAARVLCVLVAAALPLLPGAADLLTEPNTAAQPPFKAGLVLRDALARFGPGALVLAPLAVAAARTHRGLAAGWGAPALALAALVAAGIAAPHQFPYLVVLAVPGAMLVGHTPRARGVAVAVAVAHAVWLGGADLGRLGAIATDPRDRAVDRALAHLATTWTCAGPPDPSCSGDALVLLAGGGGNDDDKRRSSPVLWRLPPWQPMPRLATGAAGSDHRRGHPRRVAGHAVYVFDEVRPALAQTLRQHPRAWIVVYGDGPRRKFLSQLREMTGVEAQAVGADHLLPIVSADDTTETFH